MRRHACRPRPPSRPQPAAPRPLRAGAALPLAAAALVLGAAGDAAATIYKCQGEQGVVAYQEAPCLIGRELRNFDLDPPPEVSVIPAPPRPPPAPPAAAAAKPRDARPPSGEVALGKAPADASARRFVRSGMTEGEVRALVGKPDATAGGSRGAPTRWSYLPAPDDPDTVTTITFSGGVVSDVSRKVIRR